jgi:hypothetical protein
MRDLLQTVIPAALTAVIASQVAITRKGPVLTVERV